MSVIEREDGRARRIVGGHSIHILQFKSFVANWQGLPEWFLPAAKPAGQEMAMFSASLLLKKVKARVARSVFYVGSIRYENCNFAHITISWD